MQVVEHEHERLLRREQLQQLAHRAMAAVALVLERHLAPAGERRQRREDERQLSPHLVVQRVEPVGREPFRVLLDRVHEHPERHVSLELRRRPDEHEMPARVGLGGELGEQARLADAGLADQHDRRRSAPVEFIEKTVERAEFVGAPDELLGSLSHFRRASRTTLYRAAERRDQGARSGCPADVGRRCGSNPRVMPNPTRAKEEHS